MKIECIRPLVWTFWLITLVFSGPVVADTLAPQPLSVTAILASPKTISLGEAILLHYRIVNASNEDVDTYMGMDEQGWMSMTLTNTAGQNISQRVDHRITSPGGSHIDGARLQTGGSTAGYLVPTQWFAIPLPGTYVLHLHAHIPYGMGSKAVNVPDERYEHDLHTVLDKDFSFTIRVAPMDIHHLREASRQLRRQIIKETDSPLRGALVRALLSEPEDQAHWTWQELAEDPRLTEGDRAVMAEGLSQSPCIDTADTLAYLVWQTGDPRHLSYYTPGYKEIAQMYNSGDDALREHIRNLYAEHGIQVADKIDIPQILD